MDLCEELRPMFREPTRSTDIDLENKGVNCSVILRDWLLPKAYWKYCFSLAQQTVSSAIAQVTAALNSCAMRKKYIVFPKTLEDRNNTRTLFYNKFGIPGVLGCIDCTQVAIVRPTETQREERYYCRKQYHSLNVQLPDVVEIQEREVEVVPQPIQEDDIFIRLSPALPSPDDHTRQIPSPVVLPALNEPPREGIDHVPAQPSTSRNLQPPQNLRLNLQLRSPQRRLRRRESSMSQEAGRRRLIEISDQRAQNEIAQTEILRQLLQEIRTLNETLRTRKEIFVQFVSPQSQEWHRVVAQGLSATVAVARHSSA